MIRDVPDAEPATLAGFDRVIDVRSPSEFAQDHVPGAINLPVLSDEERARVGTLYVQDDPFRARRLGAALVSRNIARHLEGPLAGLGGAWRPLVYCWRGGQRSNAFATVLDHVGWRTSLLRGGYKTYRRAVVRGLYEPGPLPPVVLLSGGTGVGKTEVLAALAASGRPVVDLEALAGHRGSLLGAIPGSPQPPQRLFESRLFAALSALDPARPLLMEAESSKLGELMLPPRLWTAMAQAPVIALTAPFADRVRRLVSGYGEEARGRPAFAEALTRLPRHIGGERLAEWRALLEAGRLEELAGALLEVHYDPAYGRSGRRTPRHRLGAASTGDGSPAAITQACCDVEAIVAARFGAA